MNEQNDQERGKMKNSPSGFEEFLLPALHCNHSELLIPIAGVIIQWIYFMESLALRVSFHEEGDWMVH